MPLDVRTTRTITRTATIEMTQLEIENAIAAYIVRQEKSLKDYALRIEINHDGDAIVRATVTATLTTEREQGEQA